MSAATIIKQASDDGVTITASSTGHLKLVGDQTAVNRWVPVIREHKPDILVALQTDPAVLAIKAWLAADKADALECGMTDCRDCANYRGHDRTCAAKKCPTPLTLYRRCELFKPKEARL